MLLSRTHCPPSCSFWLWVLHASRVGMSLGNAIRMSYLPIRSSRGCAASSAVHVNRCAFRSSSHIGWCRLKSPIQICCSFTLSLPSLNLLLLMKPFTTSILFLLLLQSLYMLSRQIAPNSPCNRTPVTSDDANGISSQLFVDILRFIKMMALVFPG